MPEPNSALPYRRVRGLGSLAAVGLAPRLYLGPDHLLEVRTVTFRVTYRRFYYRDIQAVVLVRKPRPWLLGLLGLGGLGWGLLVALAEGGTAVAAAFLFFLLVVFGAFLTAATCRCCLRTVVGPDQLYSVRYVGAFETLMRTLRPLIEEAQTDLAERAERISEGAEEAPPPTVEHLVARLHRVQPAPAQTTAETRDEAEEAAPETSESSYTDSTEAARY